MVRSALQYEQMTRLSDEGGEVELVTSCLKAFACPSQDDPNIKRAHHHLIDGTRNESDTSHDLGQLNVQFQEIG